MNNKPQQTQYAIYILASPRLPSKLPQYTSNIKSQLLNYSILPATDRFGNQYVHQTTQNYSKLQLILCRILVDTFLGHLVAIGGTESIKEQKQLEKRMGFSYQQCIGELIYAFTICRIDISIAIITLSQDSLGPAEIHYDAVT